MKIKIVIPAMEWTTLVKVPKQNRYKSVTMPTIAGHQANIRRLPRKVQQKNDAWKAHARDYLGAKLMSEGWDGKPIEPNGLWLITETFFYNKVHPDTGNVHKLLEDILVGRQGARKISTFYLKNDKNMGGTFHPPQYDKMNPRVEVTIERVEK